MGLTPYQNTEEGAKARGQVIYWDIGTLMSLLSFHQC